MSSSSIHTARGSAGHVPDPHERLVDARAPELLGIHLIGAHEDVVEEAGPVVDPADVRPRDADVVGAGELRAELHGRTGEVVHLERAGGSVGAALEDQEVLGELRREVAECGAGDVGGGPALPAHDLRERVRPALPGHAVAGDARAGVLDRVVADLLDGPDQRGVGGSGAEGARENERGGCASHPGEDSQRAATDRVQRRFSCDGVARAAELRRNDRHAAGAP